jgi:AraC-like DNA-binding protein
MHGDWRNYDVLARVAERVGYMSETAFSAAFRRAQGGAPGRLRTTGPALAPSGKDLLRRSILERVECPLLRVCP